MPAADGRMLRAALAYARLGWPCFPQHGVRAGRCSCGDPACTQAGKHPRLTGGVHGASTDPEQLRDWWGRWPEANIGLAPTGWLVLDIDPRHGGDIDTIELPETPVALTGGGGWHVYLQPLPFRPKATAGEGLDIRCAGRPVTAPPSRHGSGRRYRWQVSPAAAPLAPCPAWLVAAVTPPPPPPPRPIPAGGSPAERLEAAMRYVAQVPGAPEGGGEHGGRDRATWALGCKLLQHFGDLHEDTLLAIMVGWDRSANVPPLGEAVVRQKLRSAQRGLTGHA